MNIIIWIILAVIIFIIAINITISTPQKESERIPSEKHLYANPETSLTLPTVLENIKKEYLNPTYNFNLASLPVTSRSANNDYHDRKYIRFVRSEVEKWNEMFTYKRIIVNDIVPLYIAETEDEFLIKANVSISYDKKNIWLQLTYYGKIEQSDTFDKDNVYILQLTELKKASDNPWQGSVKSPFMTMPEQMKYVNKVKQMHNNES